MGNQSHKDSFKNRNSNASVFEMSIDTKNPTKDVNSPNSDIDLKEELKDWVHLEIENEINEVDEIIFEENEDKSDENDNYIASEGEAPPAYSQHPHGHRSKSHVINPNPNRILFHAPKPKMKIFDDQISPFKLSNKTFGGSHWRNKKPNAIILDYQKTVSDSKSCNDNQNSEEDFFDEIVSDIDTERTTPNVEDLKNLQNCRKKMAFFRDSIDNKSEHSLDESDKMEEFFIEKKNKNKNKKNKFWSKHIKQQIAHSKISNRLRLSTVHIKKTQTLKPQKIQDNGLFILGVLESAAKEKKQKKQERFTSIV